MTGSDISPATRIRLAYYSSIPCEPTFGGPLQIHRHFRERNDFDFIDLNEAQESLWSDWIGERAASSRIFQRLSKTRLYPWLLSRAYTTRLGKESKKLAERIKASGAEAVVTVAYGRRCYVARNAAKLLGIPLITFYHDWWPDLVYSKTPSTLAYLDRCFRKLASDSDLILPVSEAMLNELGAHPNATVLPPIPRELKSGILASAEAANSSSNARPLVIYAGNLTGGYGRMLSALALSLLDDDESPFDLLLYGPIDQWRPADLVRLTDAGIYKGILSPGLQLDSVLNCADWLLVAMDFEPASRRRVRTSFPSKILDYAPYNKPLLIWGPEDCFATEFAAEQQLGIVLHEPNPVQVMKFFPNSDTKENPTAVLGTSQLCHGPYSANAIHGSLAQSIFNTIKGN